MRALPSTNAITKRCGPSPPSSQVSRLVGALREISRLGEQARRYSYQTATPMGSLPDDDGPRHHQNPSGLVSWPDQPSIPTDCCELLFTRQERTVHRVLLGAVLVGHVR